MNENMFYGAGHLIFQKAEELRKNMTPAEEILWKHIHINEWHLKFRRQHPISNYVVDFYCHDVKLVIELDGGVYDIEEVKHYDKARENYLEELGLTVLRFKNEVLFKNINEVLKKITKTIKLLQNSLSGDVGKKLFIVKIGGNIIDDEIKLSSFLKLFSGVKENKILVHGGGKLATQLAEQLNIPQQLIEGRRITDEQTLKVVTMVYAGYINKNIVAKLQANGCNAIGLSGTDGNVISAHKRNSGSPLGEGGKLDFGFVGDIDTINSSFLKNLLDQNFSIVLAPITSDKLGQLLNTNADTIAQEVAKAMSNSFDVELIYSFEKKGVLLNADDENSVVPVVNPAYYQQLRSEKKIFAGMIPKLDNAFSALHYGVKKVIIGKAEELDQLIAGKTGTIIINE